MYRVECRKSGRSFAAKQLVTTRKKQRDNALAEINLIKGLASPYIIRCFTLVIWASCLIFNLARFIEAFEMDKGIVLVTELLQGGELFERCVDEEVTLTEVSIIVTVDLINAKKNFFLSSKLI